MNLNPVTLSWIYLLIASAFEMLWAVGMKYAQGFTRWPGTIATVVGLIGAMGFLMLAVRRLPIGTAYAVWTGLGAVGVAVYGIAFFQESASAPRLISIGLVILGVLGLKLTHG